MIKLDDSSIAIVVVSDDEDILQKILGFKTSEIPLFYWVNGGDNNIKRADVYDRQRSIFTINTNKFHIRGFRPFCL